MKKTKNSFRNKLMKKTTLTTAILVAFQFIGNSNSLLPFVDQFNIWAQVLIGVSLIVGLGAKYASFAGAGLLFLYYIANPPFVYNIIFVDRNLIELFAILVVAVYNTSNVVGLDIIVNKIRKKENGW